MSLLSKLAQKLRGHPCEKLVKQKANEFKIEGAKVGLADFQIDLGEFSNKIKEFYKVTNTMVSLDNSQYMLCTSIHNMDLDDNLKQIVHRIRLQTMVAFNQLEAILGSILANPSDGVNKELEDWISYMSTFAKRSIESLNPSPGTLGMGTASFNRKEGRDFDEFLNKTMKYQGIDEDEMKEALNILS